MEFLNFRTGLGSFSGFKKISPVNGLDKSNPVNSRQNNYAWSITEMGDYLYVGTGRNFVYSVLKSGIFGQLPIAEEFGPANPADVDMGAEIWKYKRDGSEGWRRVYKAAKTSGNLGFRFMINYAPSNAKPRLYAGAFTTNQKFILLRSFDGELWEEVTTGITNANSTRSMLIHGGKLYMATIDNSFAIFNTKIYELTDPINETWTLVSGPGEVGKNPRGEVTVMRSFNGYIYVGTAFPGGFEVWRTEGSTPEVNKWKLVVDNGAGDALNEIPLAMGIYKDELYVGSAIRFAFISIDPKRKFLSPKGFDIIKINKEDQWTLVVGGDPREVTTPSVGTRGKAISGESSGFGNVANGYCWQIQEFEGELYVGTWDWTDLIEPIYNSVIDTEYADQILKLIDNETLKTILKNKELTRTILRLIEPTMGFDLYKSTNGTRWSPISLNGLDNKKNYGVRNLYPTKDGNLILGSANPFEGCEVWIKKGQSSGISSITDSIIDFIKNLSTPLGKQS